MHRPSTISISRAKSRKIELDFIVHDSAIELVRLVMEEIDSRAFPIRDKET